MKIGIIILFISFLSLTGSTQKHDNVWILGSKYHNDGDSCQYGIEISFDKEVNIRRKFIKQTMLTHNNSFSDQTGKLMYYTNGCSIRGMDDQILPNGDSLNLLFDYNNFCAGLEQEPGLEQTLGYPYGNASLFLPLSNEKTIYLSLETWNLPNKPPYVFSPNILATMIDNLNRTVVYKNRYILPEKSILSRVGLTAIKNTSNTSWWVIARNQFDSLFRILLINSDTIIINSQSIGNKYVSGDLGQSGFSPDGRWYAWYSKTNGLELMRFDRELGIFSEYQKIKLIDTTVGVGGISFSSNGRFLYVNTFRDLYQLDLISNNINQSVVHIRHSEDLNCGCSNISNSNFYQMQLGPDCKIYISSQGSTRCLHVIKYPDRKGKDCQFIEAGLTLPSYNHKSIPQFPNYRIDQAYPCDSTIRFATSNLNFGDEFIFSEVYPNPGYDVINLNIELGSIKEASFSLLDINGEMILEKHLSNYQDHYSFDIIGIPAGIYFYSIQYKGKILKYGRFIKIF